MTMTSARFTEITQRYPRLRLAVVGDFCLDRYLEIDPTLAETSLETGLPVHNVVRVRSQPGGAGTILNNLVALGIGELYPVGFCGQDGEGYELQRGLGTLTGVRLDGFVQTAERRTFTYCKPLLVTSGKPPVELNRLDSKNWSPTPRTLAEQLAASVSSLATRVDGMIVLDQVDLAETGVVTRALLDTLATLATQRPDFLIIADSRRGLRGFPQVTFKMNQAELAALTGTAAEPTIPQVSSAAARLARQHGRSVFPTLAERGIVGATPHGEVEHVPALPVRGEIDIVGAGDAVTANLMSALAAGATLREALALATVAASIVIHQLGTTGTASVPRLAELLTEAR